MLISTLSFSALFSALFCFVFRLLLHPVFYISVQSLSESLRSKGFYVMEQNNRQKCILAIRMSSVSGPEMVGQRWMARGIQLSCVQAQRSLSPASLLLCLSSPHLLVSVSPSLSHTFYFGCMIGVSDLAPAGTCSVDERWLTDGEVEGCDPDNSASGIDGTILLSLD